MCIRVDSQESLCSRPKGATTWDWNAEVPKCYRNNKFNLWTLVFTIIFKMYKQYIITVRLISVVSRWIRPLKTSLKMLYWFKSSIYWPFAALYFHTYVRPKVSTYRQATAKELHLCAEISHGINYDTVSKLFWDLQSTVLWVTIDHFVSYNRSFCDNRLFIVT